MQLSKPILLSILLELTSAINAFTKLSPDGIVKIYTDEDGATIYQQVPAFDIKKRDVVWGTIDDSTTTATENDNSFAGIDSSDDASSADDSVNTVTALKTATKTATNVSVKTATVDSADDSVDDSEDASSTVAKAAGTSTVTGSIATVTAGISETSANAEDDSDGTSVITSGVATVTAATRNGIGKTATTANTLANTVVATKAISTDDSTDTEDASSWAATGNPGPLGAASTESWAQAYETASGNAVATARTGTVTGSGTGGLVATVNDSDSSGDASGLTLAAATSLVEQVTTSTDIHGSLTTFTTAQIRAGSVSGSSSKGVLTTLSNTHMNGGVQQIQGNQNYWTGLGLAGSLFALVLV